MRWFAPVALVVALVLAAGCKKKPAEPAAGSGSAELEAPPPPPKPAGPVDAALSGPAVSNDGHQCQVGVPGVKCTFTPADGVIRGKRCWRTLVAVKDLAKQKVDILTSEPACATDIAQNEARDVGFVFQANADPLHACSGGACEVLLVGPDEAASAAAKWRGQLQDKLGEDKAAAAKNAADQATLGDIDWPKLFEVYIKMAVAEELRTDPNADAGKIEDEIRSHGPAVMGLPKGTKATDGQLACAKSAKTVDAFHACFPATAGSGAPK